MMAPLIMMESIDLMMWLEKTLQGDGKHFCIERHCVTNKIGAHNAT